MNSTPPVWYFPFFHWTTTALGPVLGQLGAAEVSVDGEPGEWELVFPGFRLFLTDGGDDDDLPASLTVDAADYRELAAEVLLEVADAADRLAVALGGIPGEPEGALPQMLDAARREAELVEHTVLEVFSDVSRFCEHAFGLNEAGDGWISTVVGWNDTERTQLVFLERREGEDGTWVVVSSAFAPADGTDPMAAVRHGGPLFGVWIDPELEDWVLGTAVPLISLQPDALEQLVLAVASLADDAELAITGPVDDR
jgi:hypothetical protein